MSLPKTLYALAIALLVVAFVGFGISAFYPAPKQPDPPPELEFGGPEAPEEEKQLMVEQQNKQEAFQKQLSDYNRVVASISIGLAVLLLVGSLLWISGVPVIGDGVMLGAVFTLFYGLIRALMTEDEMFRFVAVAVGLVVLLALVYWRFIRSKEEPD